MSVAADPPYADREALRSAVLGAGLLIETDIPGIYHRSGEFEDVLLGVERYAAASRLEPAPRRWFPPILGRDELVRTDYVRSFPHLIGTIDVFTGTDREHAQMLRKLEDGEDWATDLSSSAVALSSSICHHLYATLPAEIPAAGVLVECSGFAFRHEPSRDLARMQSFRMYEFVRVGTPEQALQHRDTWRDHGLEVIGDLGLPVRVETAHDPFFGRIGAMLGGNQVEAELKFEVLVDLSAEGPTAVASANYHLDHFGSPYELMLGDGSPAHSACFGFGLERLTLALFASHGADSSAWPQDVRRRLGLP